MRTRILLAEDDADLGKVLKQFLELEEFEIVWCLNGIEALESFKKSQFDLCIIDVMMPKMDGFTFASEIIKLNLSVPFIFLTARNMKLDRLTGLKLGADDYISKPFEADELVLRIRNILKRGKKPASTKHGLNDFELDLQNLLLTHPKGNQSLTQKEAELLSYFFQNKNQLIKTSQILKEIWGEDDYFMGRSMNVFVSRLRKFLSFDPSISIENTRGVGYQLNVNNR